MLISLSIYLSVRLFLLVEILHIHTNLTQNRGLSIFYLTMALHILTLQHKHFRFGMGLKPFRIYIDMRMQYFLHQKFNAPVIWFRYGEDQ